MSLSFKKRIASYFMLATAIIIAVVFGIVYLIVQQTVYKNIDNDLSFEANKHIDEITIADDSIKFKNKNEWEESEHKEVQVNPVFLQLIDGNGQLMDKSPNLKQNQLPFRNQVFKNEPFNTQLNKRLIRQVQIPISKSGRIRGYIIAAMSLDGSIMVLKNLRFTLFLLYPIVLLGLFFVSSFLAGRSIVPVIEITKTANRITKHNLNERIDLPPNKDELHDLSSSINALLGRLENALEREKQFTSDASHELRTPLSVLRGTLEVLIRKERSVEEYEEKISYSLTEIDRMANIIDQLLSIARFDTNPELTKRSAISILDLIDQIMLTHRQNLQEKNLKISIDSASYDQELMVNSFHTHLILGNIIGNAVKYSNPNGEISVCIASGKDEISCSIVDQGIGIKKEDLDRINTPFFRSDALNHKEIKGVGLGLSIAQKAAQVINAEISFSSKLGKGTKVTIRFKEILRKD